MKIPPILGVQNWGYISLREGVFFPWGDESVIAFTIFSICYSPQKSSITQKVYSHSSLGISCIFLSKFMIYLFCGLARPFIREGR